MDGAGAASSAPLSARAPAEVAASGHGRGHLLPGPLRLRVAHAAAPLPAIDAEHRSPAGMSAKRTGPTVHAQRTRWRKDGALQGMHDRLREHARQKEGPDREPP